jgi:hydrogenase maturation protein HypF
MSKKTIIEISGLVQGVGFRPFVYRTARRLGIRGYVRNLGDAGVEIQAEGSRQSMSEFINAIEKEKPENARIDEITVEQREAEEKFNEFRIIRSGGVGLGGTVAPDIMICEECINEIFTKGDRRHGYEFTTCTDCGPRFTTLEKLPFDRKNTAFKRFPPCINCRREYKNPGDRRFHAQTIACPECGPRYFLLDRNGKEISKPIDVAIKKLGEGKIIAIKGIGGVHLACTASGDNPAKELRSRLQRKQQPFAVMSTLEMAKTFTEISGREGRLLTSKERPIVILKKKEDCWLSDLISPGLGNVGVLLPYTGLHHILFTGIEEPLVMTSANIHGNPMITENKEIVDWGMADYYLLHDLEIRNRCDDSVIKIVNKKETFIRRSRGFAPTPIEIENHSGRNVLALGADENITFCLLKDNSAFLSQHIGNAGKVATLRFLEDSIKQLMRLIPTRIDSIACDLHPGFNTTRLAEEFSMKLKVPLIKVQHHHAHLSSLIAEHRLREIVGICCDGIGYGLDGRGWGGEIISFRENRFRREGHLREQPMPGGDLAAYYPARMVAGILYGRYDKRELETILNELYFRHGKKEIPVVLKQLEREVNIQGTTSTGRVLDAISTLLGICPYRTYEGEPAMKLEAAAELGKDIEFPIPVRGNILDTGEILEKVLEFRGEYRVEDIAFSAEKVLAEGLAEIAVGAARKKRISTIGISGGVAYNNLIVSAIADYVGGAGLRFVQNEKVPCGDGGISFGQVGYAIIQND